MDYIQQTPLSLLVTLILWPIFVGVIGLTLKFLITRRLRESFRFGVMVAYSIWAFLLILEVVFLILISYDHLAHA